MVPSAKPLIFMLAPLLLVAGPCLAQPVTFKAADGKVVHADFEKPSGPVRATLLLFHMAGSNRGEYAPLAPWLNKAGFATLAVDLRSGGSLWGQDNETAAAYSDEQAYADALPDMEGALAFAAGKEKAPLAVWGSSYSSALVFVVASTHPEVKALLSFSPAEYIDGYSIAGAAGKLAIPVFVTSSDDASEVASARLLVEAAKGAKAEQYVPKHGVHGSSSLRDDQNPEGAADNRKAVTDFLDRTFPAK